MRRNRQIELLCENAHIKMPGVHVQADRTFAALSEDDAGRERQLDSRRIRIESLIEMGAWNSERANVNAEVSESKK